jgi:hypothetical protein
MSDHAYLSTYCFHSEHDSCRLVCKMCAAPCACLCHDSDPVFMGRLTPEAKKTRRRAQAFLATHLPALLGENAQ